MMDDKRSKAATVVHTVGRPAAATDPTQRSQVEPQLQQKLMTAVTRTEKRTIAIELVLATLRQVLPQTMVVYIDRDSAQSLRAPMDADVVEQLPPGAPDLMRQWAGKTCQSGSTQVHELSGAHRWTAVTVPVILRDQPPEVICAVYPHGAMESDRVRSTLQLGASHITLWSILQEAEQAKSETRNTSALLELLTRLDNCRDLGSACYVLVNDLREYLGCGRIVLGLTRTGMFDCRVAAVSGLSDFDQRSEFSDRLESVLNEALVRDEITLVGVDKQKNEEGTRAHQALRESSHAKTLISAPLRSGQGEVVGAWLFVDEKPIPEVSEILHFVRASQVVVGSRLCLLQRAAVHPIQRLMQASLSLARTRKFAIGLVAAALIAATLAIPMNYKVRCDCQLEPVSRRFVAAPYEGTLRESLVEAGQIVSAGQVLARMDARELRWELSGLEADYESEKKKRDAAAARDEVATAQQSNLQMQRLDVQMQLIQHRLENLDVKSPIDGVVIAGDLKKSEGTPLSIGQAMFEIGPLEEMIVEVAIPERDIMYVNDGMTVEIRLDAAPGESINGPIVRIAPRSEIRDNENVYIAEVELSDRESILRPGMKGTAKVISDPHPLGWNLLHKPWESLAMLIGW